MKYSWILPVSICLIFSGCMKYHGMPKEEVRGVMTVLIPGEEELLSGVRGIFYVNGLKKEFMVFFQDSSGFPQGKLSVEKGKIRADGLFLDPELIKYIRYWPFLFGWGKIKYAKDITYGNEISTSAGRLPEEVTLKNGEDFIVIKMLYGN